MRSVTTALSFVAILLVSVAVPAAEPAPRPRPAFTLDQLNPADIPAEERFGQQPKELIAVLGTGRGRHASNVACAAISPDGTLVATGGFDKTVRLWDAKTLGPVAVLKGHTDAPIELAFSPDGKWLTSVTGHWSGAEDRVVRVWAIDGAKSRLAATGRPHDGLVVNFQYVRDGRELLTVSKDGEVRSWDLTADPPAEKERFLVDPGKPAPKWVSVDAATFTPDGRTLFVRCRCQGGREYSNWAELWDVATGKRRAAPAWQWNGMRIPHRLLPDGKTLAFGMVARGQGRQAPVRSFPDGTKWTDDQIEKPGRVVLWDLSGREPKQVGTAAQELLSEVRPAGARRYITVDRHEGTIHVWATKGDRAVPAGKLELPRFGLAYILHERVAGYAPLSAQCLSADGTVLVAFTGSRVRVWELTDDGPVERAPDKEPTWNPNAVAFGLGGRTVMAAGAHRPYGVNLLIRWDLAAGPPRAELTSLPSESRPVVFSRDGRRFLNPANRKVYDAAIGEPVCNAPQHRTDSRGFLCDLVESVWLLGELSSGRLTLADWKVGETRYALNGDGAVLAETADASWKGERREFRVWVWDVRRAEPELIARLAASGGAFTAVAVSPDGRLVAVGTSPEPTKAEGEIVVWNVGRAEPVVVARFPAGRGITVMAFTADGKGLVAALPEENRVRVWDLTPKPRERWSAEVKDISALAFTPDARLVGLTGDGLTVWDARGKVVTAWRDLEARAIAVASDGRHIATANANGTIYILRLPQGPEVAPHPGPTGRQIVERAEKAYAGCKTYRDRGTVAAEYTGPDGKKEGAHDKPRTFTTAFRRGGAFRFEFNNPNPLEGEAARNGFTEVVWAKGDEAKTWPERELHADPGKMSKADYALGVIAGVTEGVTLHAPRLVLLPPKGSGGLLFADTAERIDDERIGAADCYRVRLEYEMQGGEGGELKVRVVDTYWIDRRSYLIRRLRSEGALPDGLRVVTTIDYDPAFDVNLAPAELEFRPPKKP